MPQSFVFLIPLILFFSCNPSSESAVWIAHAPADTAYCRIDPEGQTVLPNGRLIEPRGKTIPIAPHPYGLVLSPDGTVAITANSGTRPFSISILEDLDKDQVSVRQIPDGPLNDEGLLSAVFMGLAISPDNQTVYVAGGQENVVFVFDIASDTKLDSIDCSREGYSGYIGDMVLNKAGSQLYAVDQVGFELLILDTKTRSVAQRIPVGRYPFGVCLSPDEQTAYVANVGMFEYSRLDTALEFPAFGYQSREMKEGIDSLGIPGLGDPNAPEAFSVWAIDVGSSVASVRAKIKTGFLIGEEVEGIPAVGGSSPNSLVATEQYVFVSNGNNDCISVIDPKKDSVLTNIRLSPDKRLGTARGVIPFGLALSPDQRRLYVAESGINAVGVIDVDKLEVIGHLPLGWFPAKLAVSPDGKRLIVANAKGYGSGPNGGKSFEMGPEGSYIGSLMKGSVSILDVPTDAELSETTAQVLRNNFRFRPANSPDFKDRQQNPVPLFPGHSVSPIQHIVFISKENRTYDEVFGQLKKGRGDASLARYGRKASFRNNAGTDSVQDCDVMLNHLALARRFVISDNFYVDADHSADGHRWLVNTYPNEWVETHVAAAYGGKRRMQPDSKSPGNLALVGSTGAIYPEDYNEHGSIWDHFERHGIDFFNFGFGTELAGNLSDSTMKYTGVKYLVNFPLPGPLFDRSSRSYATYNMAIPDQFRADMFVQEYEEKWGEGGAPLPSVLTILLPNDHGAGDRPHAGYPFRESYMMDNDLALGRIVEFLSHTPYWKNMIIVVTEDDSQNGVDHIDAHRSLLMVISPYAKRDYVGHQHYSFGSIFKTFWNILGLPYLNQYDAGATDLADLLTEEADFTPYNAYPVDARAFDPQKVLDPFDEAFDWEAVVGSPNLDDPEVLLKEAREADRQRELERNRQSNPIRKK
ncbi:MAG: bifunctional YncE family protein/alkaline phosphatase family protein [Bacteroidota bacterium]